MADSETSISVTFYPVRGLIYKFEDTKGVIRSRKRNKDRQYNRDKKRDNSPNNDLQNIHRNLKIEQHEPH
jgi:hypothetical protein